MTPREELYALVTAGAVVTITWADGFALPPWAVGTVRLSADEQLLEYHLVENSPPHHQHPVARLEQVDDGVRITTAEPEPKVLMFEVSWQAEQDDALAWWARTNSGYTVEGGVVHGQV